jgi:protocatechuate 3,4-dioxygenase beta subunit
LFFVAKAARRLWIESTGMSLATSPYCTIGPFFPGDFATGCGDLTNVDGKRACGQHIVFAGQVFEDGRRPIQNAIVEIWQPDAKASFDIRWTRVQRTPTLASSDGAASGRTQKGAFRFGRFCQAPTPRQRARRVVRIST